jgi:ribosome-associated protein
VRILILQSDQRARLCAAYALEKKAENLRLLDVRGLSSLTDYLLIVSGRSDRQVEAIAESIRLGMKKDHELLPLAVEGLKEGNWVLIDYGDLMIHVFQPHVRDFYDLEGLWQEAREVGLDPEPQAGTPRQAGQG